MDTRLQEIWSECTGDFPREVSETWWSTIVEKYSEESRVYHNLELLEKKLHNYENVKHFLNHPKAVALATIFNNFENDPRATDCEARNVAAFEKFAEDASITAESPLHQQVVSLLQASVTHSTDEHKMDGVFGSEDRHYFLDIDISPLGFPPEEYARYSSDVQEAFSFLPADRYRNLRLRVLENFLQIPNIFATKEFREKYEKQARINIAKEVENLKM